VVKKMKKIIMPIMMGPAKLLLPWLLAAAATDSTCSASGWVADEPA